MSFRHWFLEGLQTPSAAHADAPHKASWWQVMCLTGVDYFSTLGYQPSIAFVAAQYLSPLATIVVVLLTLFGALPIYNRIAALSPHGQGSLSVLEERLPRWRGKAFVLCLLGFAATDFVITITLSAADATAHIIENPFVPHWMDHRVIITLVLLTALGAIFLKGFKAIWLAVLLVALYLGLNVAVIGRELWVLVHHPEWLAAWRVNMFAQPIEPFAAGNPLMMVAFAFIVFPKLALGLSGFETGVAVMPLVRGVDGHNKPVDPAIELRARVDNTRKLLKTAAIIMSVLLIGSSFVTATMIPAHELQSGGEANGRALAFLAHRDFGEVFGTIYDISTIAILWFAGASAMAGLLNLVPKYLPRYGMAPDWARATRPLVSLIMVIAFFVTIMFDADVDAQGGAYATGVLVLMTSACVAVIVALPLSRKRFYPIAIIFIYTTILNMFERPEGLKIALWFIATIVGTSLVSRVLRSTEIRIEGVDYDAKAEEFIESAAKAGRVSSSAYPALRIIANRPDSGNREEYDRKLAEARREHHLPESDPVIFLEIRSSDASEFSNVLHVRGVDIEGHRVLRCSSPAIPNAIAGLLLNLRDRTDCLPHAYFGWTEGNPIAYLLKFLAFGEGDTAPVCREVLRQAEHVPERRPRIHVG